MDKKAIIRNFSRYADTYDRYCAVQRQAALALLEMTGENNINKILELGCGTGNYTYFLRERFPDSAIKAIDISREMIQVAAKKIKDERIEFILGDAETIDLGESFDLVTSNACFQWLEDLQAALAKYKKLLKENGFILFSVFGPRTFWELNMSVRSLFKNISITADNFVAKERLEDILNQDFKEVEIKETAFQESFFCLSDMLNKIKHSGINGSGIGRKFLFTPRILKRLEEIYLNKFSCTDTKQMNATYQVFFCRGVK
ncbi:MAG: malonyl-ACP O-methyltransferase BioC [Candidatus Omnitrophica bacterium]|nr:malonyl-ACP O-methyltransferase BioC [Candidatus Omnitrophota bacterium]